MNFGLHGLLVLPQNCKGLLSYRAEAMREAAAGIATSLLVTDLIKPNKNFLTATTGKSTTKRFFKSD